MLLFIGTGEGKLTGWNTGCKHRPGNNYNNFLNTLLNIEKSSSFYVRTVQFFLTYSMIIKMLSKFASGDKTAFVCRKPKLQAWHRSRDRVLPHRSVINDVIAFDFS